MFLKTLYDHGHGGSGGPFPKPTAEVYAAARLLDALVEARLALEFLQKGLVRNAAEKAFQAWRAVLAALLRLEAEKLAQLAKTEEKRWLAERAVPRIPITKIVRLSQMLEDVGYVGISAVTSVALHLLEYKRHGPDPDMALSKYLTKKGAAVDVVLLTAELVKRTESLRTKVMWRAVLEEALDVLKTMLTRG